MKLLQLTPNLMVADVANSTTFYKELFDLEIQYMIVKGGEGDDGFDTEVQPGVEYQYAGLIHNDFRIGLQEKESILADVTEITEKNAGTMSGNLYFEVESLEEIKDKLADTNYRDVPTTWYGMQEIYLSDPDGYIICIAQKDPDFEM